MRFDWFSFFIGLLACGVFGAIIGSATGGSGDVAAAGLPGLVGLIGAVVLLIVRRRGGA